MKEIIEFLSKYHTNAPPFISENEDGTLSLVGSSDLIIEEKFDYGKFGKCMLTARNHTKTLLALMNAISLFDQVSEHKEIFSIMLEENKGEMSEEDAQIVSFMEEQLKVVLEAYFMFPIHFEKKLLMKVLKDNKQLVNEALYNVTKDKETFKAFNYEEDVEYSLEGEQFEDPYIGIAYDIANKFKIRPYEVIKEWSSSELIVIFAKLANENSLEAYINFKESRKKSGPKQPKKQKFFFKEIEENNKEIGGKND